MTQGDLDGNLDELYPSRDWCPNISAVIGGTAGEFGALSNFSRHPVELAGVAGQTVEHVYQALKFEEPGIRARILSASTPKEAKRIAWANPAAWRSDWTQVNLRLMRALLAEKARRHADVRAALKRSGSRPIVEWSRTDSFWGACPAPEGSLRGRNVLGILWMEIRRELAGESEDVK